MHTSLVQSEACQGLGCLTLRSQLLNSLGAGPHERLGVLVDLVSLRVCHPPILRHDMAKKEGKKVCVGGRGGTQNVKAAANAHKCRMDGAGREDVPFTLRLDGGRGAGQAVRWEKVLRVRPSQTTAFREEKLPAEAGARRAGTGVGLCTQASAGTWAQMKENGAATEGLAVTQGQSQRCIRSASPVLHRGGPEARVKSCVRWPFFRGDEQSYKLTIKDLWKTFHSRRD